MKLALIGTHGVGKTTLCFELAARLKRRSLDVEIVREVARRCPLPINQQTTVRAQEWILLTQMALEIEASAAHEIVLCDRSVLDNYCYLVHAAGTQPLWERVLDDWIPTYDLLVWVPQWAEPGIRRRPRRRPELPAPDRRPPWRDDHRPRPRAVAPRARPPRSLGRRHHGRDPPDRRADPAAVPVDRRLTAPRGVRAGLRPASASAPAPDLTCKSRRARGLTGTARVLKTPKCRPWHSREDWVPIVRHLKIGNTMYTLYG